MDGSFLGRMGLLAVVGAVAGCPVPSTLGLPCEVNSHCDPGQICVAQVCEMGMPGESMGPMTMPPPMPTSGMGGDSSTSSPTPGSSSSTSLDPTTSSSTTASEESTSSDTTGPACGVESCTDLDVLLLVDTSDSMQQWLIPLANSLPSLFSLFEAELEEVCTFHIGLANADRMPSSNTDECQFPGALIQRSETCGDPSAPPYYSSDEVTASEAFAAMQCTVLDEGFGGDDDERMLESLLGALSPDNSAEGACNDGFRRPGANLVVVYVSDEDDPTPTDELDTVAETFNGYVDGNLVAFISVVGDPSNQEAACQWSPDFEEGTGAEIPSALSGFLALSDIPLEHQARVDICQTTTYEFDDAFQVFTSVCGGG